MFFFYFSMRAGNGFNNNPSCREFISNYKKILLGGSGDINGERFNVMIEEADKKMLVISDLNDYDDDNADNLDETLVKPVLDDYDTNIIEYTAGYVCRKIAIPTECTTCFNFLVERNNSDCQFIKFKEKYSLFVPHKDILTVCNACEIEIRISNVKENMFRKNLMDTVVQRTITNFCLANPSFFQSLNARGHDASHRYIVLKKIVIRYFKIRMHRESKIVNIDLKCSKIRQKYSKLILQKHE